MLINYNLSLLNYIIIMQYIFDILIALIMYTTSITLFLRDSYLSLVQ